MSCANFDTAKRFANNILQEFRIVSHPIDIDNIITSRGLGIVYGQFPGEFSNVSGFLDIQNNRIVINVKDSPERQVFTKAHELGHWLMHRGVFQQDPSKQVLLRQGAANYPANIKPLEQEANCFAAELLVPYPFLQRVLSVAPSLTIDELAFLFKVSREFMSNRIIHFRG